MHAALLRADVDLLSNHFELRSLFQLPWKVVAASVKLQVLVPLEALVADFAEESVCGH